VSAFDPTIFLPDRVPALITDARVQDPERALRAAEKRVRRAGLTLDGRLNVVAADHPARRVLRVGDDPLAMADRRSYLSRIVRALMAEDVDGVMATMDVLEELLVLDDLLREAGGPALLDGKLLIASLNRGGLAGAAWEMDDPMTGPTPADCAERGLDGAKLLLRVCDDEPRSLRTLEMAAEAIRELSAMRLPAFLEVLPVVKTATGYEVARDAGRLAALAGVASALGDSSRYLWLKLPYCEGFGRVAAATTLPVLLLGGEASGDPVGLLREMAMGLASRSNVRGAMIGRNALYPGGRDPLSMARAVGGLVHRGWSVEQATAALSDEASGEQDAIARWL
jgi:hypothetical protein